ncbi:MAG: hypothetical protein ACI8PZ_003462 [Myxococcota bacterium]|jgi:hypothetical protein
MSDPDLPFKSEIAEVRAQVDRGSRAQVHLLRIQAALQSLSVIETQRRLRPDLEWHVPGDDVVAEVTAEWSLSADEADAADPFAARRAMLRYLESVVQPHLAGVGAAQARLTAFIEQQKRALAEPEFAPVVETLKTLAEGWTASNARLQPLEQRVAVVGPAIASVSDSLDRLDLALAGDDERALVRASRLAEGLLASLTDVLSPFGMIGDLPESTPNASPRESAEALHGVLEGLGRALAVAETEQQALAEAAGAECAAFRNQVFAITG